MIVQPWETGTRCGNSRDSVVSLVARDDFLFLGLPQRVVVIPHHLDRRVVGIGAAWNIYMTCFFQCVCVYVHRFVSENMCVYVYMDTCVYILMHTRCVSTTTAMSCASKPLRIYPWCVYCIMYTPRIYVWLMNHHDPWLMMCDSLLHRWRRSDLK